jgi:hypothetical protein
MERVRIYPYVVLLLCGFIFVSMKGSDKEIKYEKEVTVITETPEGSEIPFTFKAFKQFVLDCKIKFPDIVIAQAVEESGEFKSDIWIENHNPFGMKLAGSRNTTNVGENRGHAKYKNWQMAVIDYAYMQAVFARKIKTRKGYYEYLKNYAENPKYADNLKRHLHKYRGFSISNDYLDDL